MLVNEELYGKHTHKHTRDCLNDDMEKRRGDMSPLVVRMEHRLHMRDTLLPESPTWHAKGKRKLPKKS